MTSPQNFISEDTTIKGNITTASTLTIAGAIEGDRQRGRRRERARHASVKCDISGPAFTISGKVEAASTVGVAC